MSRSRASLTGLALAIGAAGIALDQAAKALALTLLEPGQPIRLLGGSVFLDLHLNPGAAFGLGQGITAAFAVAAIVALIAIVGIALPRLTTRWQFVAAGCLIAGIGGNLLDRLFRDPGPFHGHVVDFISFPHLFIFNVADIFITCTAVALGLKLVFFSGTAAKAVPQAATAQNDTPAAGSDEDGP